MEGFLTVLWRYRFFFNASHYLGGISPDLALRQSAMRLLIRGMIRRSTADQIALGTMRPPRAPSNANVIAGANLRTALGVLPVTPNAGIPGLKSDQLHMNDEAYALASGAWDSALAAAGWA
ncbi:MAG: hypothetical protein EON56_04455 [Alphaproteobacteria bacterium]|nr:MAG: hypothetical protein EON56_04455 [Alphaproteobacteria bacterium]